MNEEELLVKIKNLLGMGQNNFQDDTIKQYIEMVKLEIIRAGVDERVANSKWAIGCITRGIIDKWNFKNGVSNGKMYEESIYQLRAMSPEELSSEEVNV